LNETILIYGSTGYTGKLIAKRQRPGKLDLAKWYRPPPSSMRLQPDAQKFVHDRVGDDGVALGRAVEGAAVEAGHGELQSVGANDRCRRIKWWPWGVPCLLFLRRRACAHYSRRS
jgi:hypothetical protein